MDPFRVQLTDYFPFQAYGLSIKESSRDTHGYIEREREGQRCAGEMGGSVISIMLSSGQITIYMISKFWKIWDEWDVHGVILLNLSLQIFLIFFASLRKRSKGFLPRAIWLAYLLADWAASYCVGLISNNQKAHSTKTTRDHLTAFWSPFLLLHLGGPNTITAYALEDNELWLRHLLGLIFQSGTAACIFVLTVHDNSLWFPTLLVFVAGLIKYTERTRALYVASFNAFRQSLVPDPGPDYGRFMVEFYSRRKARLPAQIVTISKLGSSSDAGGKNGSQGPNELEAVRKGFFFFQKFRGIIVDMIYSFDDRREIRRHMENKTPGEVLEVIEIELNFMYESFYTKVTVVRKWFGYCNKFVSFTFVLLAFGLFILEEKRGLDKFDTGVTYALLCGALALDTIAFVMHFFTEYTATLSLES
ncbi:uncharacterized protein LOC114753522 [Neltuma alba]|uniref:uncharacterized protein LOC114753522 n=1 Tax=Neltuma alba TaxID=207710 RepID=UPI0010A3DCA2|nr:uncharacterized protein LOC114753522 [Prosopis alba]